MTVTPDLDLSGTAGAQPGSGAQPAGVQHDGAGPLPAAEALVAPGRLGEPLELLAAGRYVADLGRWVSARRRELARLDEVARRQPPEGPDVTADLVVAMALFRAVEDKYALLDTTHAGGRVGPAELSRLSTLVWGRLDPVPEAAASPDRPPLAVNLPEACRLLDTLSTAIRAQLGLDGAPERQRIRAARAGLERIRGLEAAEPAGTPAQSQRRTRIAAERAGRLDTMQARLERGGDIEGVLAPIEAEIALAERDLLVAAGQRVARRRDREAAVLRADELAARGASIRELESRCVAALTPAPRLAVPDVRAIGPVPDGGEELTAYRARLDQVSRALDRAMTDYAGALHTLDGLRAQADALRLRATATVLDPAGAGDLRHLVSILDDALGAAPVHLPRAQAAVAATLAYLDAGQLPGRS